VTEQRGSVRIISRGLAVNPRVHVAFFPPQVLADPVSGQSPVTPFLANGAFRNGQNGGYIACRKHTVGTAQGAAARLCVPSPIGTHLFRFRVLTGLVCRRASPPSGRLGGHPSSLVTRT
jgi:hypothetical protein